jgi:protein N-terminal methyltransferase
VKAILESLKSRFGKDSIALELGVGIGRVTNVLSQYFDELHIEELREEYLDVAKQKTNVSSWRSTPLQLLEVDENYSLAWIQWALMWLTDEDVVRLVAKLKGHAKLIVVRENVAKETWLNHQGWSINRTKQHFKELFKAGGYEAREYVGSQLDCEIGPVATFILEERKQSLTIKHTEDIM